MMRRFNRHENHPPPSTEDSWRMVEGENDSFDASLLPVSQDSGSFMGPKSSGSALPSQFSSLDDSQGQGLPSQPSVGLGSQDSLRDFQNYPDDENLIMRQPFKPTMSTASGGRRSTAALEGPALKMPRLDHSSEAGAKSHIPQQRYNRTQDRLRSSLGLVGGEEDPTSSLLGSKILHFLGTIFLYIIDILVITLRYLKKPLGLLVAIYLVIIALAHSGNWLKESLTPFCRFPGATMLPLTFCDTQPAVSTAAAVGAEVLDQVHGHQPHQAPVIDIRSMMNTQDKLKEVLGQTIETVYLPEELSRSRDELNDLSSMITVNNIYNHGAMSQLIRRYVKLTRTSGWDIQKLNTGMSSTINAIIEQNRRLARVIASEDPSSQTPETIALYNPSLLSTLASWFQFNSSPLDYIPTDNLESAVLKQYRQLASQTLARTEPLLTLAQDIQRDLGVGSTILQQLHDLAVASSNHASLSRNDIKVNWWSRLGGNAASLQQVEKQIALIDKVQQQRSHAVQVMRNLEEELADLEATLRELREQTWYGPTSKGAGRRDEQERGKGQGSAGQELVEGGAGDEDRGGAQVPMSVYIGVLERGIARLEITKMTIDKQAQRMWGWRKYLLGEDTK